MEARRCMFKSKTQHSNILARRNDLNQRRQLKRDELIAKKRELPVEVAKPKETANERIARLKKFREEKERKIQLAKLNSTPAFKAGKAPITPLKQNATSGKPATPQSETKTRRALNFGENRVPTTRKEPIRNTLQRAPSTTTEIKRNVTTPSKTASAASKPPPKTTPTLAPTSRPKTSPLAKPLTKPERTTPVKPKTPVAPLGRAATSLHRTTPVRNQGLQSRQTPGKASGLSRAATMDVPKPTVAPIQRPVRVNLAARAALRKANVTDGKNGAKDTSAKDVESNASTKTINMRKAESMDQLHVQTTPDPSVQVVDQQKVETGWKDFMAMVKEWKAKQEQDKNVTASSILKKYQSKLSQ